MTWLISLKSLPFHIPEHHSESRPREEVTTVAAATVSIQIRNEQHMPCPNNHFHHPSITYAQLPCSLTLWKMWYMTWRLLFIYRFPYAADTVRKYILTLVQKSSCYFAGGLERMDYALRFMNNSFQIIFMYVIYLACDSSAWNTKKTPCHFIWDKSSGLKVVTENGSNACG